jgi:hypothetical protein
LYSQDLAPSDFHVIGPTKDGPHGQHFPDDAIIAVVRKCFVAESVLYPMALLCALYLL